MGNLKFALSMLKKNYKNGIVYTLTLAFTTAIVFIFFNIIENQYLLSKEELSMNMYGYIPTNFSLLLAFIIVLFCAFMIVFAYNFYVSKKNSEIAIMTMSGSSFLKVTAYLIYQTVVMSLIAFAIGLALGFGSAVLVNQYIYELIHVEAPLFYMPKQCYLDTVVCVLSILAFEIMYISGYVYRKDISYLLMQEHAPLSTDERILKYPSWIYPTIYLTGLVFLFMSYTPVSSIFPAIVGSIGIGGMIKYFFPKVFRFIKDKKYLEDKIVLISMSNLYYSLKNSNILIGVYAVSVTVMNSLMIMQQDSPREFMTSAIGFVVLTILVLACIVYKYVLEASGRKRFYGNLYKIGFVKKQMKKIVKREVISFYLTIYILPMIYIVISLMQSYIYGDLSIGLLMFIMLFLTLAITIAGVFTYYSYKKEVVIGGYKDE